ncbi:alpha/beta hydrolase [Yoonia sp. 2307UL14-13]|uniref:alpha/beta hydrolase n=1 Tax=Yoonia sp. 2307UL14-13 TaxID=3126506 RepID=UPI003099854A
MVDISQVDEWLAAEEAKVPNLRPRCEKRVVWVGEKAVKTPLALLYIHGFSASPEELRPLPDLIAQDLGANIHFTRLAGHGQDSAAMATATLDAWMQDVAEAVKIAQTIGDEIILMGCSTGCTLATLALAQGLEAKAAIYVSPNFGLRNRLAQFVLDAPGAHRWGRYVAGATRSFEPINDLHTAYWTTVYPTEAVHPMGAAVRAVRKADLSLIKVPLFLSWNEADTVVHPKDTRAVARRWGGPVLEDIITPGPGDDEGGHVMAGDVFSPGQTRPMAKRISAWFQTI